MNWLAVDKWITDVLEEDIGFGDMTTEAVTDANHRSRAELRVKTTGVLAGLNIAGRVFQIVHDSWLGQAAGHDGPGSFNMKAVHHDGELVSAGTVVAVIEGSTRVILLAERVALNILQRLSGIATLTRLAVDQLPENSRTRISDTRKTTPGMRMLEKYAVRMGGGVNHRQRLDDAVMIKDNHIAAAGGITAAVERVRERVGHTIQIEVEVENLAQVHEAVANNVDIILLDNMTAEQLRQAVDVIPEPIISEASGGMTIDRVRDVAATGVDIISIGWLTHSATALDISLNVEGNHKHTSAAKRQGGEIDGH